MMLFIVVIRSVIDTDHRFNIVVADCRSIYVKRQLDHIYEYFLAHAVVMGRVVCGAQNKPVY